MKLLSKDEIKRSSQAIQDVFREMRQTLLSNAGNIAHTTKPDGTPVTTIDVDIENEILDRAKNSYPTITFLGEESGYNSSELPQPCWLLDPIDGTSSFIKNTATFTCMAVLIVDNEAVASITYDPTTDCMYVAYKDEGAYKNNVKIDVSVSEPASVALCKGRFTDLLDSILIKYKIVHQSGIEGAGFGFIAVADGDAAAVYRLASGGDIHDYAGGALLIREAGGVILPVLESTYTFRTRSFIACHPKIAATLKDNIDRIREQEDPTKTAL